MLQAANQMDALIQDLLDVTGLEAGRLRIVRQRCAIGDVMHAAVDTLTPLAAAKSLALEFQLEDDLPLVQVDPARMVQVLSNLVGNAIKFTPRGGRVALTAVREGVFVSVAIADTGPGIPPDELPQVFDRFWQSKRTNRSGAGLGLAIARGIVRAHGGTIGIESAIGRGTMVRFSVPAAEERAP
jgi:signal transduction histidine kinase